MSPKVFLLINNITDVTCRNQSEIQLNHYIYKKKKKINLDVIDSLDLGRGSEGKFGVFWALNTKSIKI